MAGCRGGNSSGAPAAFAVPADPKPVTAWFPIRVGDKTVRMQLAVLEAEMEHGLMERRDLAEDEGMIFVNPSPRHQDFWMHDCPTPLDVGFFTPDGILAEIYPMYSYDDTTVSSRGSNLQFALEMNQGWFQASHVGPGAQLDLKALAAALAARGFDPQKFGLPNP
jgi:uncharacterized membrane protein (UPF0127 family)